MQDRDAKILLLIGPPKCGTSSIFYWLSAHPSILGSQPKETYFFVDPPHPLFEFRGHSYFRSGRDAFCHFFNHDPDRSVYLEASTHSYFQDSALEFSRHHEQTYVCFIVRDPAFRLLSHFRYLRDVRGEVCARLSFNHYVDQIIEYGKKLDRNFFWTEHAQYILGRQIDLSNYPMWIEKWSAALPAERFKVIAFERLAVEPTLVLAELNEWIGVGGAWPPGFTFAPHNETYRPRSHAVHRLAATIARRIPTGSLRSAVRNGYFYAQKSDQGSDRNFALGVERMTEAFRPVCNALDELRPELSLRKRWRPEAFG